MSPSHLRFALSSPPPLKHFKLSSSLFNTKVTFVESDIVDIVPTTKQMALTYIAEAEALSFRYYYFFHLSSSIIQLVTYVALRKQR